LKLNSEEIDQYKYCLLCFLATFDKETATYTTILFVLAFNSFSVITPCFGNLKTKIKNQKNIKFSRR